jgi:hypothetical protein
VNRRFTIRASTLAVALVAATWPAAVASAASGSLGPIHCTPMRTDPALEAPLYAQQAGANGSPDGWWCQLPHATMVPSGYRQVVRTVAPLADLYSDYTTQYGPTTGARGAGRPNAGHEILVTDYVDSSVMPPTRLHYPPPAKGSKVALGHGVTATMVRQGSTVSVTWRYPVHGVPKYLRAVAQVTVSGTGEPQSVVVGVARHVQPD